MIKESTKSINDLKTRKIQENLRSCKAAPPMDKIETDCESYNYVKKSCFFSQLTETIQLLTEDIKDRREESTEIHRFLCKLAAKVVYPCRTNAPSFAVSVL